MSLVFELLWFHIKSRISETELLDSLTAIKNQIASTPGLEAMYFGKGVTIPQSYVGQSIIKVWSSKEVRLSQSRTAHDSEFQIARHVIHVNDPTQLPSSLCFSSDEHQSIPQVLTAPVVLLSCMWLPVRFGKAEFQARHDQVSRQLHQPNSEIVVVHAWSISIFDHPILGKVNCFLILNSCTDIQGAYRVASGDAKVFDELADFRGSYDQHYSTYEVYTGS